MARSLTIPKLIVRRGAKAGHGFPLKKTVVAIGSDRKCDLVLSGEYVSPLHAVIQCRDDGVWTITNRSVNSTLVNQAVIDTKPLEAGDVIQIGAETLLEFEAAQPAEPAKVRSKKADAVKRPWWKQSWAIALIAIYLTGLAAGGIYLSGRSGQGESIAISWHVADRVLKLTAEYFASPEFLDANAAADPAGVGAIDRASEEASNYYRLVAARAQDGRQAPPGAVAKGLIDQLSANVGEHLARAWHLEGQHRWKDAAAEYEQIMASIPDIRAPAARFAAQRLQILRETAGDE